MEAEKIARTYAAVPVVPQTENSKPFIKLESEGIDKQIQDLYEDLTSDDWRYDSEKNFKKAVEESKECWENSLGAFSKEIDGVDVSIAIFYFFPTWIFRVDVGSGNEELLDGVVKDYLDYSEIPFIHLANYQFFKADPREVDIADDSIASRLGDDYIERTDDKTYEMYFKETPPDRIVRILDIAIYDLYQSSIFLESALDKWNEKLDDFSSLYEIKNEVKISPDDISSLSKFMNKIQDLLLELGELEETVKYCSHQVKICKNDIEFYVEKVSEEAVNTTGVFESIMVEAGKNVFLSRDLEAFFEIIQRRHQNLMEFIESKMEGRANRSTLDLHAIVKTVGVLIVGLLGGLLGSSMTTSPIYTTISAVISLIAGYLFLRRL